ncbi:tumor protein D54-like isoform X3 [Parambassis ranga]|uniref:Tumor protein D54-like isoform X3 n=1 Tax=Parambassis ranga TaxID=210632 RepID=A0A6P7IC38_9TELE|nr:tumor protein D54-like isoform X3 [Parambassis ranga]
MSRQGYSGVSSSVYYSTRLTGNGCSPAELTDVDIDNLRFELAKVEDEIQTLRQALLARETYAADIRRQLGMGPLSNIKQNLSKGWQEVQTSTPYVRTREGLSHAGHVTSAALSNVGVAITRRLGEMRALPLPSPPRHTIPVPSMRHSNTFKSLEEMVGNVKDKVTGSLSNNEDVSGFDRRTSRHST